MCKRFHRSFCVLVIATLLAALFVGVAPAGVARAAGEVSTCNETSLNTALSGGGTITFACDGIITITAAKTISVNTTLDATGHQVTLDGGNTAQIFRVNTGISLTIINLTIQNGSSGTGGAIYTKGGLLTIQNSRFLNNNATGATGNGGGAIFADVDNLAPTSPVQVRIENSLFENNTAPGQGGSIFVDGGESGVNVGARLDILNSTFRNNRTTGNGDGGAILANFHVTVNSEGSLYAGNQARGDGGAIATINPDVVVNLANNTFSGNSANQDGSGGVGGALNLKSSSLVQNTFYGNVIGSGGPNIQGSAIHWADTGSYTVTLRDNIFANNTGSTFDCMKANSAAPYGTSNLGDDTSCNNGAATNPVTNFNTSLQENGGPTQTHALLTGSNAIDSASACTYASSGTNPLFSNGASITRDQRGAARPFGSACDKGAYEFHQALTQGTCGGPDLSGIQTFTFANGKAVSINVITANGLNCITVEQMGQAHLLGLPEIQASNNWFHIRGNISSGFNVNLSLPANNIPDSGDQVCRYTGTGTQIVWDCSAFSFDGVSITRNGATQFSDWAIFEDDDPTAITLSGLKARTTAPAWGLPLAAGLLALAGGLWLRHKKFFRRASDT